MASFYFLPIFRHAIRVRVSEAIAHLSPVPNQPFPTIDTGTLSPLQVRLLSSASSEYSKHPASYDQNVSKYTQSNDEAWCADFVSWLMLQAGVPYVNPNSGSWRIPGVLTLQDYNKLTPVRHKT